MEITYKILAVVLAVIFLVPEGTLAVGYEKEVYELSRDTDVIIRYINIDKDMKVEFDRQKAINDGVNKNAIRMGDEFMKYCTYTHNSMSQKITQFRFTMAIHGRYCGPRHSGPGKPIDKLDAACKAHDECYAKRGRHRCSCDHALWKRLIKVIPKLHGKARAKAEAMQIWAKIKSSIKTKSGGNFSCRR